MVGSQGFRFELLANREEENSQMQSTYLRTTKTQRQEEEGEPTNRSIMFPGDIHDTILPSDGSIELLNEGGGFDEAK